MSDYGVRIKYIEPRGRVAIVTLDRPDKRNAFDEAMWASLEEVVGELKKRLPRAIVVAGGGGRGGARRPVRSAGDGPRRGDLLLGGQAGPHARLGWRGGAGAPRGVFAG